MGKTDSVNRQDSAETRSYDLDQNAGRLLLLGFRLFERSFLRYAAEAEFGDIRMSHLSIIRHIREDGSRTTDIAELAKIKKQTAGALASELEEMRYVTRQGDPLDGRAKLLQLAPRGLDFMAVLPAVMQKAEADMMAFVGEQNFAALKGVLVLMVRGSGEDAPGAVAP